MINGSGEILRALGRLEATDAIVLHEVREVRREQRTHGERLARLESVSAEKSPPSSVNQPAPLILTVARWSAAVAAVLGGIAANLKAEQIASLALALLKP